MFGAPAHDLSYFPLLIVFAGVTIDLMNDARRDSFRGAWVFAQLIDGSLSLSDVHGWEGTVVRVLLRSTRLSRFKAIGAAAPPSWLE
jgi:hypothetical protein